MIYALPAGTRVVFLRDSDAGDGRPAGWIRAGDLGTVVAAAGAGLVLMHMRGRPGEMYREAVYDDVAADVKSRISR